MDSPSNLGHLRALTDDTAIFEHAMLDVPRRDHGYCVDDVARALIVVVREPTHTVKPAQPEAAQRAELATLTEIYLRFLERALLRDGLMHNRMSADGEWTDAPGRGDWWGRAVWAFGVAAVHGGTPDVRARALSAFRTATRQQTTELHPLVFAALGAADVVVAYADDLAARRILRQLDAAIPPGPDAAWPWPEPRLRYGNAAIPESLIAAGHALGEPSITERGLQLLAFLVSLETRDGQLSVTGSAGRDCGDTGVLFDQQPIEVAAIADACARAFAVTGDDAWLDTVARAWAWFEGNNDSATPMIDANTGAGFDGLEQYGRNENRGAESTLAALSVYQQASRLGQLVLA